MKNKYQIQGMSCGGCVSRVRKALLEIPGVENADVRLKPQSVLLTMTEPIDIGELQAELSKAGNYTIEETIAIA